MSETQIESALARAMRWRSKRNQRRKRELVLRVTAETIVVHLEENGRTVGAGLVLHREVAGTAVAERFRDCLLEALDDAERKGYP